MKKGRVFVPLSTLLSSDPSILSLSMGRARTHFWRNWLTWTWTWTAWTWDWGAPSWRSNNKDLTELPNYRGWGASDSPVVCNLGGRSYVRRCGSKPHLFRSKVAKIHFGENAIFRGGSYSIIHFCHTICMYVLLYFCNLHAKNHQKRPPITL